MSLLPLLAVASPSNSTLTGLDWLAIAMYFCVLAGVAAWVVRRNKDTATDYFLAGRNLGWWIIGASIFASNIGSEHIVGLAGSGASDGVALAHYELHAWCLLVLAWVFVPFYSRSLVFTMPEFLERRFSTPSRYVLSIVSIILFILSKIAVGIFAGGVVFATLLPEIHFNLGGVEVNSFWIGSVSVILLTGLYTTLGGMRAVAYNDAVQVLVLIGGSATLTLYGLHILGGWGELRRYCGSEMLNLWHPFTPAGVESTWSPVLETNAAGALVRQAWYFNSNFPWPGMLICAPIIGLWYWCTDQYIVQRALGAPNEQTARRGSIFAAFLKLFPVFLFIVPGLICFALAKSGKVAELGVIIGRERQGDPVRGAGGVPAHGEVPPAARPARDRGRGPALRAHGVPGRRLQRLLDALHGGHLPEGPPPGLAARARPHGAHRDGGDDRRRPRLDPGHPGGPRPLRLPPDGPGLPRAADLRRVLLRGLLEAAQRHGVPLGAWWSGSWWAASASPWTRRSR